jgi:hypothetical protein
MLRPTRYDDDSCDEYSATGTDDSSPDSKQKQPLWVFYPFLSVTADNSNFFKCVHNNRSINLC